MIVPKYKNPHKSTSTIIYKLHEVVMQKTKYLIHIDKDLWKQFKTKCFLNDISMIDKIIELIKNYLEEK